MACAKARYGFGVRKAEMGVEPAPRSRLMPSSINTAEARVVLRRGKYRRLARKVMCPGSACSIPAMPRISASGAPSRRQASFCAISESFMDEAPQVLSGSLAQARRSGERERRYTMHRPEFGVLGRSPGLEWLLCFHQLLFR